jgi:hypothetical protein
MQRFFLIALASAVFLSVSGCGPRQAKQSLESQLQSVMRNDMQMYFDQVHPVGTATDLKLHSVSMIQTDIGPAADFIYTVYWEGPVQKDGFTKCRWLFDLESERTQDLIVLQTNGITNDQVGHWLKTGGKVAATALAARLMDGNR